MIFAFITTTRHTIENVTFKDISKFKEYISKNVCKEDFK